MNLSKIKLTLSVVIGATSLVFILNFGTPAPDPAPDDPPLLTAETPAPEPVPEIPAAPPPEPPPEPVVIPHAPENREPQASGHFLMSEYACDCAGFCDGWPAQMSPALLERIEALRSELDSPVIITSGVRCPERNAEVGGIENSWHLSGHAADLYSPGVSLDRLTETASRLGLGVLPYYGSGYLHVELWQ